MQKPPTGILAACDDYERRGGLSPDAYCPEPSYHPMAEGKYLSTLAVLHEAGALSEGDLQARAARPAQRLMAANVAAAPDEAAWGLGFSYKGLGPAEPYLITTALVADGLLDCPGPATADLAKRSLRWLQRYPWREERDFEGRAIRLPRFSPNTPAVVTNVVARWARVLGRGVAAGYVSADPVQAEAVRWVLGRYVVPAGWPYDAATPRVDLLHQCYILNALAGLVPDAELEAKALQTLSHFAAEGVMWDKFDITDAPTAAAACARSSKCSMLCAGPFWVLRYHQEARPWSYGELLVTLGRLVRVGACRDYWSALAGRVRAQVQARFSFGIRKKPKAPPACLPAVGQAPANEAGRAAAGEGPALGFRDAMHLAHGLAALFALGERDAAPAGGSDEA